MNPRIRAKNRGSATVWAVCSMLIVALLAVAILAAASYYGGATLREENVRKARLTAHSAVDTVFAAVQNIKLPPGNYPDDSAAYAALRGANAWLSPADGEPASAGFSLDFGDGFGQLEALTFSCTRQSDGLYSIVITATASYNGQFQSRSAAVNMHISGTPLALAWEFDAYR